MTERWKQIVLCVREWWWTVSPWMWRGEVQKWRRRAEEEYAFGEKQQALFYELLGKHQALEKREAEMAASAGLAEPRERQPGLTAAEIERLAWLMEECGEVTQAVGKVLRHGYAGAWPAGAASNRVRLERELGDLRAAVDLMAATKDVRRADIGAYASQKTQRVLEWMKHQPLYPDAKALEPVERKIAGETVRMAPMCSMGAEVLETGTRE